VTVLTTWTGRAGDYLAVGETPERDRAILGADPSLMVRLYYADQPVPSDILDRTLDRILARAGYLLPGRHPLRNALTGSLRSAIATIRKREEAWKAGDWSDGIPSAVVPDPAPQADVAPALPSHRVIRLGDLHVVHIERTKPKPQSVSEQKLAIRQLGQFLGRADPLIHEITFEQAEQFYDTLKWLPKSLPTSQAARPLVEIAEAMRSGMMKRPRAAGATAAKKLQLINAMFSYAAGRGWLPQGNPFARLAGPKDSKPAQKRRPFTSPDLTAIFSAPLFVGCASYTGWRHAGQMLVANHRFWLPLLALVTGGRLEELGQLLVADVRREDGVMFLDITEEDADEPAATASKSIKTHTSVRRVPLHQIALDVGFQTYWGWLVETGERRLFPELPATGKRTKEMSRWFGRAFRPSVGITDPSRTFHSFRHLFKDRCRAAKLRRDLHDSLTGHADGSAGAGYGDGLTLDDLKSGIDTLAFPGFPGVPARRGPFILAPERGAEIC
jgi:integrase